MIVTIFAERSLAYFNLQRKLRSSAFSLQHIYAVRKLSSNHDEPPGSTVLLQKILVLEGGVKPPTSKPMPMLSHKEFRGTLRSWLRQAAISRNDFLVPFHLPPCNVVAASRLSLGELVGNHHKMMEEFDWDTPPSCPCQAFKQRHPEAQMAKHPNDDSQHVATRLCSWSFLIALSTSQVSIPKPRSIPNFKTTWKTLGHSSPSGHNDIMWVAFSLRLGKDWEQLITKQWELHYPEFNGCFPCRMSSTSFQALVDTTTCILPQILLTSFAEHFWRQEGLIYLCPITFSSNAFLQPKASQRWLQPYK